MNRKQLVWALMGPMLLIGLMARAQDRVVTGKITDAKDGTPLLGVTVVLKGTTQGTTTNADGVYRLDLPAASSTLVVSYIGYNSQQVTATPGTLNIQLQPSSAALNEVVVIGYGSQQKKDLTGSIATLNSKDFQKGAITSPDQLIEGKIAGVTVTPNGGAPGSGSVIRIRGLASLNGNNDPLIVVDGVPLSGGGIAGVANPLDLIDPNDIANVTVLKDASAAAIYGSRASSGVILITTKRGKPGKPHFNFSSSVSMSKIEKKVDVLSPAQLRAYVMANGDSTHQALLGKSNTDWQNEIYQTAITTNNELSMSGSVKNMPYRISLGYLNQQGVLKTDDLKRTTGSVHLNPSLLNNHLKIDLNLNGTLSKSRFANQGAIGSAVDFDPTQPVYQQGSPFGGYFEWMQGASDPNPNAPRNPVALLMQRNDRGTANRSFGNVKFDYSLPFLPELHAVLNLGYDVSKGQGTVTVPADAAQSWATTTNHGYNSQYLQKVSNTVAEFSLDYNKYLKNIYSNINVTAGYGFYNNLTTNYNYASLDSKGDTIPGSAPLYPFDKPENTLISYYGRVIYTFHDKYILTASLRTDGSSRFAPNVRWGTFPAVAAAWKVSQENFLKNSNVLSDLKLRASYGVTGNQDGIGDYGYLPDYYLSQNGSQYQFGNSYYYMYTPSPYVSDLKWEQTASTNIGVDYGFLNNRIYGSFDYYYKKTTNLLDYISIPVGSNFTNKITTNVGDMTSKGVEFSVNAVAVQNKKLTWTLGFNIAYNKVQITKLRNVTDSTFIGDPTGGISGATGQSIQIQSVGYQPYSFFVFQQVYGTNGMPLEGVYVDRNKDGVINQNDMYRYKTPFPPVTMGFSTDLEYGKWSFSLAMHSDLGNYMYNNVDANLGVEKNIINPVGILGNSTTDIYNSGFLNNQYQSDYYVQNASFLRMDNIGLSYRVIQKKNVDMNLSLHCQNAFVITKYRGLDPEVYGGIDNNLYPRPRVYTLGLNLGF